MSETMTPAKLVTEWGKVYRSNEANMSNLVKILYSGFRSNPIFKEIRTDDTIYKGAQSIYESILQGFKVKFSPAKKGLFVPNEIRVRNFKIDELLLPAELWDTYVAFMANVGEKAVNTPFTKWIIEEHILPAHFEAKEETICVGRYVAPDENSDAPEPHLGAFDGLLKVTEDGLAQADPYRQINSLTLDPLSSSNIIDMVNKACQDIKDNFKPFNLYKWGLIMSSYWADRYAQARLDQGLYSVKNADEVGTRKIDLFPNVEIQEMPFLTGNDSIIITPIGAKGNLLKIIPKKETITNFDMQSFERYVKLLSEGRMGIGYEINKLVWAKIDANYGEQSGS